MSHCNKDVTAHVRKEIADGFDLAAFLTNDGSVEALLDHDVLGPFVFLVTCQ